VIDCSGELEGPKGELKVLDNAKIVEFSYGMHCMLANISYQVSILKNLVAAVGSDNPVFQPFKMLLGARNRKNDINVIIKSVQSVDCFCCIRVEKTNMRQDTLEDLGKLVIVNSNILDVEFSGCKLSKDYFSFFSRQFRDENKLPVRRAPLRLLNLHKNLLGNIGDSFKDLSNINVDCLVLSDCRINTRAVSGRLMPLLMTKSWLDVGGLRILNLKHNWLGLKGSQDLLPFLKETRCLEELGLAGTGAELITILQTIVKNKHCSMQKLAALDISENKMAPFAAVALAEILEESSSIHKVNIQDTSLDDRSFEHIMNKISNNHSKAEIQIDVSSNKMGSWADSAFKAMDDIGSALVGITMANNSLGESKDFMAITTRLRTAVNLKFLNLDLNFRASRKATHRKKIEALADCVRELKKLEVLSVKGDKIHQKWCLSGDELVPIIDVLEKNTSLKEVNLSGNRLSDKGAKALFHSLKINRTLMYIDIDHSKLTFEDLRLIIEGIGETSGLQGVLPRETLNRLYNEKKRNREVIKEWSNRLSKIFSSNFLKAQIQLENEEKIAPGAWENICAEEEYFSRRKTTTFSNGRENSGSRNMVGIVQELSLGDIAREFNLKNAFISTAGSPEFLRDQNLSLQLDDEPRALESNQQVDVDNSCEYKLLSGEYTDKGLIEGKFIVGYEGTFSDEGREGAGEETSLLNRSGEEVLSSKAYSVQRWSISSSIGSKISIIREGEEVKPLHRLSTKKLQDGCCNRAANGWKDTSVVSQPVERTSVPFDEPQIRNKDQTFSLVRSVESMEQKEPPEKRPREENSSRPCQNIVATREALEEASNPEMMKCSSPVSCGSRQRNHIVNSVPAPAPRSPSIVCNPKPNKKLRPSAQPRVMTKSQVSSKILKFRENEINSQMGKNIFQAGTYKNKRIVKGKKRLGSSKKSKNNIVSVRAAQFEAMGGVMGVQKMKKKKRRPRTEKVDLGKYNVKNLAVPGFCRPDIRKNSMIEEKERNEFEVENQSDLSHMTLSRARIEDEGRRRKRTTQRWRA